MRREFLILSLILTLSLGLFACGGSETPKDTPKDAGGTAKPAGDTAKSGSSNSNPWGSFKVGSFVKMKTTTSMQIMGKSTDTVSESKMTLADLTADKAVLDVESTIMGNTSKTRTEVPLTAGAVPPASAGTAAPNMGTDTISVAGKSLNCKTMEVDTEAGGNKVHSKTWTSDQVPGFVVKTVAETTGATSSKTTMEVVDFKAN